MLRKNDTNLRTVLVIEDDFINREILKEILSPYYTVITAENGREGLDTLIETGGKISLILLDIQMPVMNGHEFLEEISNMPSCHNIPIIVTTSSSSSTDEIKCLENGAADFVTKPYNTDIVLRRVGSMIRLAEASSVIRRVEHDYLTGFYTREFFYANAERILRDDADTEYDIICCEIDAYKMMRSRYGKQRTDDLVLSIADGAPKYYPQGSIFGRLSDNKLFVMTPHQPRQFHEDAAEKVRAMLETSDIPDAMVHIGVNCSVERKQSVSSLCNEALIAIEGVRYQYGRQIAEYTEELSHKVILQQKILGCMENALHKNQFEVYYQPKHRLAEDTTGGAEALVRWVHPDLGFISPGSFIPLFEKSGFIKELDSYIADRVCSDLRRWLDAGMKVVPVSWNLSRVDFEDTALAENINKAAEKYNIPKELIHLEVTESAYNANTDAFLATARKLHDMGFSIELDDFGTGYSSLTVLSDLDIDVLKLDMCFARNLASPKTELLLRHIFAIARDMGMSVVAEGAEEDWQVEKFNLMGCTYVQGYYYSKPLPRNDFEAYLNK